MATAGESARGHRRKPSAAESMYAPTTPRTRIGSLSSPVLAPRTPLAFIRSLVGAQEVPEDVVEVEPTRRRERSNSQSSTPTSELDRAYGDDADDFLAPDALDDLILGPPMLELPELPTTSDQSHHLVFAERSPLPPHATPVKRRRPSVASHETRASTASRTPAFGRNALRMLKTLTQRPEGQRSTHAAPSVSSSDSSSTLHWRFWRGSSSSGSTRSGDFEVVETPTPPAYTLILPQADSVKPFERITCDRMVSALERLKQFWDERAARDELDPASAVSTLLPIPLSATTLRSAATAMHPSSSAPNIAAMHSATTPAMPRRQTGPIIRAQTRPKTHTGPTWWLDVQCPTPRDMRALRKLLPLHPLTMEDILQQDMREKSEVFESLGYQFVVFRAIDEKVFRLEQASNLATTPSPSDESKASHDPMLGDNKDAVEMHELPKSYAIDMLLRRGKRKSSDQPRVSINPGSKEGIEGSTIGAVNVYLIILEDGLVSFHNDPIDKHLERVFDKIMQYGATRTISPHWVAYGLMDSIVDAFFPMLTFIEQETKDISDYLSDPLGTDHEPHPLYRPLSDERSVVDILLAILPSRLAVKLQSRRSKNPLTRRPNMAAVLSVVRHRFDQKSFLNRIAEARKLISGLVRLLGSKTDAVKGLRKRVRGDVKQYDRFNDVSIYYGDLLDHIVTMHQALIYLEAQLAHDHPVYTGLLRVSLERAKQKVDHQIVRLYIITLVFIPVVSVTGLFSMNVMRPENGGANHVDVDGNPAGFTWFGGVIAILTIVMTALGLTVKVIFVKSRRKFAKRHFLETL